MVSLLVAVHALCGLGGLLVLPIPLVSRYGASAHRLAGWLFVGAMAGASASGLLLAALWVLVPEWIHPDAPAADLRQYGAFLGYLGLLLSASTWGGVAAWRIRGPDRVARGLDLALVGLGLGLVALGAAERNWLFFIFGLLGALGGWGSLRRPPLPDRRERHARAMFGAAIAASTAFLALGARRWIELPDALMPLVWLGPTAAGVPLLRLLLNRDRARRTLST